jgi:hypothetical protein
MSEMIELEDRAKDLFKAYLDSNRVWKFPLVSLFSFLWLKRVYSFLEKSYLIKLPFVGSYFKEVLRANRAVHISIMQEFSTVNSLSWSPRREFINSELNPDEYFLSSLEWEQDVVRAFFNPSLFEKVFFILGILKTSFNEKIYFIFPFFSEITRKQVAYANYLDAKNFGWSKVEEIAKKELGL